MDTASTLVRIYLFICSRYRNGLAAVAQRQSNNADPDFTDEEVLTVYVFGLIKKRTTVSEIHEYVEEHFSCQSGVEKPRRRRRLEERCNQHLSK